MSKQIHLYTDGACSGNPGPGGYGVVLKSGGHVKELSEGFRKTTNNRMELLAVIIGLEAIKSINYDITVVSDSKYVVDAVTKGWLFGWHKKGYAGKKNADLWQRFLPLYNLLKPKFVWIKGHAGHAENERCDQLAVAASQKKELKIDSVFETTVLELD